MVAVARWIAKLATHCLLDALGQYPNYEAKSELELEECEALKKELTEKLKAVCEKETLSIENLARAKDESAATSRIIGFAIAKVGRFLNCSMVDALI
ncbi:unnamed protein product [Lathyrus sativus]|nr:unnamed protein product [Lathyrus sativus]